MKYMRLFENFKHENNIDKILDVISKHGIEHLSKTELEYLDKYSTDSDISSDLEKKMSVEEGYEFISSNIPNLKFTFNDIREQDDYIEIMGTISYSNLPDMDGNILIDDNSGYLGYEFSQQVFQDGIWENGIDLEESLEDEFKNEIEDFFQNEVIPYIDLT